MDRRRRPINGSIPAGGGIGGGLAWAPLDERGRGRGKGRAEEEGEGDWGGEWGGGMMKRKREEKKRKLK